MRYKYIEVVVATLLALVGTACQPLATPVTPSAAQIDIEAATLSQAALAGDPVKYQKVGFSITERECTTFFDGLDRRRDRANFARQEITLAGGVAAGVLNALKAGAVPVTIAGIAFPFVANSIANYEETGLITPYPDETYILVKAALKAYRDAAPPPTDIYDAVAQVQNYAAYCTYSGIHQLAKQAIATSTASPETPKKTVIAAPAPLVAPAPSVRVPGIAAPIISPTQPRPTIPNIVVNQPST